MDESLLQKFADMNRNFESGDVNVTSTAAQPVASTPTTVQSPREALGNSFASFAPPQGNNAAALATPTGNFVNPLYSTPNGQQQTGFDLVAALQQQANQQQQYNMLNMSLPALNMFGYNNGQMGTFGQNFAASRGLPSLNVNIPQSPSTFSPSTLSAVGAAGRTVYIGNLPSTASVDELLSLVHFGPLENIRVLPDKSCVFLSFLDSQTAAAFNADATVRKLTLHNQELKIGWGKPSPIPTQVALAVNQNNASRNVYLGGLEELQTEEVLRDDLQRFGLIDQVKIVRDKNIGFVHFLSIAVAMKVVNTLPTEPAWVGKRVNYGKDRCAYIPKSQQAAAAQAQAAAAQSIVAQQSAVAMSPSTTTSPFAASFSPSGLFTPFQELSMQSLMSTQALNRTVYLGNVHPDTTNEDLCNAIRGGVLQSIRYMQDKHIAFVTFVDPAAAFTFYQVSSYQGLTLNNRRLKIGWGKNSGPLAPALALAVHSGATRNVYIGNIEDFDTFSVDRLKADFGEFGDIELVNYLKEKNAAFVNFTNISNAIKAIDAMKSKPEYATLRIAHGKDRCANPPRSGPQGSANSARRATASAAPPSPMPPFNAEEVVPASAVALAGPTIPESLPAQKSIEPSAEKA